MGEGCSEKAVNMAKASAKGSFQLFLGRIISTIVLAVGTIFVGRFISEGDYGLYTVALVPAATFLLFQDWGIGSALTKYCANYRAHKRDNELRSVILSGLFFEILTGLFLTILAIIAAGHIASIFGKPESAFLIAVSSITIISSALTVFSISVIVGFERMGLSSIIMVVSATVQGLLSPLLVLLGFGAFGAVIGATVSSVASAVAGVTMVYFGIFRKLPAEKINRAKIVQTLKPLLIYGIPLSIAGLIEGISLQVDNLVVATYADLATIGNFTVAVNFSVLISLFIYPLQTVLFPAFSKLDPTKDRALLKTVFSTSVKYSSLVIAPVAVVIMVLSAPMIGTLYGEKWLQAPLFLTLTIGAHLVVLLGSISYVRLLYAMGETKVLMKLSLITLCAVVPLAFLLVPPLGVIGAIIGGTFIAPSLTLFVGIYWVWKHYGAKADFGNSAKILAASSVSGLITYLGINAITAGSPVLLIVGLATFISMYVLLVPLLGAVNDVDIATLKTLFRESRAISKILNPLLTIMGKIVDLKHKYSNRKEKESLTPT